MEDVYTIKVKTQPDTRNLYPSERRYSASTVSGLAWVHIALAATSFLLACLAFVSPNSGINRVTLQDTDNTLVNKSIIADINNDLMTNFDETLNNGTNITDDLLTNGTEESISRNSNIFNETEELNSSSNDTNTEEKRDSNYILVLAPSLVTIFALSAGIASIMASARWYVDRNITWLFIMSVLATIFALISFIMVFTWFLTNEGNISKIYKVKTPDDYLIVKHSDVVERNGSHILLKTTSNDGNFDNSHMFTKRVLSINILIASFLEFLWSVLSVKISYKGMRNNYNDDNERPGNCISVVTKIKGNNTKKFPRNGKLLPPKPNLIQHYPGAKIKSIFLAQNDNGFYLKSPNNKVKNTETSSEFYKERMINFLNRCASLEGMSNPEIRTPSVQSENALNTIPEVVSVEINTPEKTEENKEETRITPVSWGDTPEHTIYNQNNLNFDKIFNFNKVNGTQETNENDGNNSNEKETKNNENCAPE